jgi:hypothetical protein
MPEALAITGERERTLQALAAQGRIPGAAKLSRCWTFDERKLLAWVKQKEREREQCQSVRHPGMFLLRRRASIQ